MRALLSLALLGFALLPSSVAAQSLPPQRASLALSYLSHDMSYYTSEQLDLELELAVRGGRATLRLHGSYESRGSELTHDGPTRARTSSGELEHVWTGTARREGTAWLLHFDHTTASRPPTDPDFDWRCERVEADVAGARRSVWRCAAATEVRWGPPGRPVPAYLRVPIHLAPDGLENRVEGSYGHPTHVTLS